MNETREKTAVWDDTDEETFIYFAEFAYTGDYDAAAPGTLDDAVPQEQDDHAFCESYDEPEPEPEIAADSWGVRAKKAKKKAKVAVSSKRDKLWDAFIHAPCVVRPSASHHMPRKNAANGDFTDVFLSHAKLFVFADRYEILELMKLSLYYLHGTLISFELFDDRVEDVVELIRYCSTDEIPETLKELVVQYVACKVEDLWKSETFQSVLTECGGLAGPIVGSLLARLD